MIQILAVPKPRWLSAREARGWRGYLRMRDLLDLQIGQDLARNSGLSAADYSVLAALSEAEGHQLRPTDLAQRLLWSKSRLSHRLDRMAAHGLIRRRSHPTDSRAFMIVLTGHGLATIDGAAPDHIASVRRHFVDLLTDDQLDALADATETIIEHLTGLSELPSSPNGRTAAKEATDREGRGADAGRQRPPLLVYGAPHPGVTNRTRSGAEASAVWPDVILRPAR